MELISKQTIIDRLDYVIEHGVPNSRGLHQLSAEAVREMVEQLPPANNSEIPNSSDTISRAKAIEALVAETIYTEEELREYYEANSHRNEWVNGIYEAVEAIKQLPPAQPERTPMQELLDVTADRDYWKAQCHSYEMTINRLTESAQPERIKGRWIPVGGALYQCDQCGVVSLKRKFCSECGAEMREVTT